MVPGFYLERVGHLHLIVHLSPVLAQCPGRPYQVGKMTIWYKLGQLGKKVVMVYANAIVKLIGVKYVLKLQAYRAEMSKLFVNTLKVISKLTKFEIALEAIRG